MRKLQFSWIAQCLFCLALLNSITTVASINNCWSGQHIGPSAEQISDCGDKVKVKWDPIVLIRDDCASHFFVVAGPRRVGASKSASPVASGANSVEIAVPPGVRYSFQVVSWTSDKYDHDSDYDKIPLNRKSRLTSLKTTIKKHDKTLCTSTGSSHHHVTMTFKVLAFVCLLSNLLVVALPCQF